jgi:hypothetical protein
MLPGGHAILHFCSDGTVSSARAVDGYRADLHLGRILGTSIYSYLKDPEALEIAMAQVRATGTGITIHVRLIAHRIARVAHLTPCDTCDGVIARVYKKKKTIGRITAHNRFAGPRRSALT